MFDGYMTIAEVAAKYGLHQNTVMKALHTGKLRSERWNGRHVIRSEDAEAWRSSTRQYDKVVEPVSVANIYMPASLNNAIREMANAQGLSMCEYCRRAIARQIEEDKKNG